MLDSTLNLGNSIFVVPTDFKIIQLQKIIETNTSLHIKAKEMYGSVTINHIGCGRKYTLLPRAEWSDLIKYVRFCNDNNIKFNYTLNLSCSSNEEFLVEGVSIFNNVIKQLIDIGINDFTVTLPGIIEMLANYPDVNVTLSVIVGVDSMYKMEEYCKYDNIDCIYIHERVHRNIPLLKNMAKLAHKHNKKVGIIVNSFCLSECPYRHFHYDLAAHATKQQKNIIPDYYRAKCALAKITDKRATLTMPWIRPQDISMYIDLGIDKLKITGREMYADNADMLRVIKTYNDMEYNGNLVELFMCFSDCFYPKTINIKNNQHLDAYLKNVFNNVLPCGTSGCNFCDKCKDALTSIEYNIPEQKKSIEMFDAQIRKYKENLKM
jgi:collagenase-like PrtC family protease